MCIISRNVGLNEYNNKEYKKTEHSNECNNKRKETINGCLYYQKKSSNCLRLSSLADGTLHK